MLTTGLNSTAQANEIMDALRTELQTIDAAVHVTRSPLWALPDRPATVLIGPGVDTKADGLGGAHLGTWEWLILSVRQAGNYERRADFMDTWADHTLGALLDLTRSTGVFDYAGVGPKRLRDLDLFDLIQQQPTLDPVGVLFVTQREITVPC